MQGRMVVGLALGSVSLALLAAACGSDVQTRFRQLDDPKIGQHPLDPDSDKACTASAQCEDGDRCTEDRCLALRCVQIPLPTAACCDSNVLFQASFDDGSVGELAVTALNDQAGWHVVDATNGRAASPPGALYFGDPAARTYNKGVEVGGTVTLPKVTLPRDRENVLSMRIYALIESAPDYDLFWIEADVMKAGQPGVETVRLFSKKDLPVGAYEGFALVDVPLTGLGGRDVQIRLRFDTLDGSGNDHEGLYLDDLKVEATCPIPLPCLTDTECQSEDVCLAGACSEVGCVQTDICVVPDVNPCEVEGAPTDCCVKDADCDDGDARTLDVCDGATCTHTINPDACLTAVDCDDQEACTTESCSDAGVCGFRGTIGPGCCEPGDVRIADFDNESLQGIYVTDNFETGLFWRADKTRATSGEFGLYCGDPVTQTYAAHHRVKSSATTRVLDVPKGGQSFVSLDLYKDTRTAKNYDVFQVMALRDDGLFPLWTSKSLPDGVTNRAWQHIEVPLTAYAGQKIQIRFVFDSVDAPLAGFEGVYLDTLRLVTRCQ